MGRLHRNLVTNVITHMSSEDEESGNNGNEAGRCHQRGALPVNG
jgi:hypothetical protein